MHGGPMMQRQIAFGIAIVSFLIPRGNGKN
jgi:hypothetical protein